MGGECMKLPSLANMCPWEPKNGGAVDSPESWGSSLIIGSA